jgi:hypothetical protein
LRKSNSRLDMNDRLAAAYRRSARAVAYRQRIPAPLNPVEIR